MNSGQICRPCRESFSPIPGRVCFGDLPGDEIIVSPPSPIVEPLIWCPDSFAPAIQNCKRISHAVQLLLYLANDAARTQIHNYPCQEYGGYRQGYGRIEVHSFYSREERERWRQGPRCWRCSKLRRICGLGGLTMTPRRSSGCGSCIPELTTRIRHRGRLLCLSSRAKASTLRRRHRCFAGGSVFHTSFRWLLSLLATQQKWCLS